LHVIVAIPEPMRVGGVIGPQLRPDVTRSVSETVPTNPFIEVTVMFAVADPPMIIVMGVVTAIVKSGYGSTKTDTVIE